MSPKIRDQALEEAEGSGGKRWLDFGELTVTPVLRGSG